MKLGWVDFSKEDRKKVLSVISLLSEDGTLDELGIAPIRDGFADLFFPGTSTIHTRAKYFLIVPYALDTLAREQYANPQMMLNKLDELERLCGQILTEENADGTIGSRTIKSGSWVKRTPADIYWAGIRRYGIFCGGNISLSEYIRASCVLKKQKRELKKLGNRNDDAIEYEKDDADAGALYSKVFWNLPSYPANWLENLHMELNCDEAKFLKERIEITQPNSMLAYILKSNNQALAHISGFVDISDAVHNFFPDQIQADYQKALAFSFFIYGVRIRYNILLSEGKNEAANDEWDKFLTNMTEFSALDIDAIFERLNIVNPSLRQFLLNIRNDMQTRNITMLDKHIKKREVQLKGANRAKLNRAGEFPVDSWIGGGLLDFRFGNAMAIVKDIFKGLEGE